MGALSFESVMVICTVAEWLCSTRGSLTWMVMLKVGCSRVSKSISCVEQVHMVAPNLFLIFNVGLWFSNNLNLKAKFTNAPGAKIIHHLENFENSRIGTFNSVHHKN